MINKLTGLVPKKEKKKELTNIVGTKNPRVNCKEIAFSGADQPSNLISSVMTWVKNAI